jgi:UDP-glucose 4-epimerase
MRVLITGASGLIGGRLLRHLSGSGLQVRAASRSVRVWPEGVEGCVVDFQCASTLREVCTGVDAIVNLASLPAGVIEESPAHALLTQGRTALALVEAAVENSVSRFVQVSTSKVYGSNLSETVTEDTPLRPRSHYAIIHALVENYVLHLHSNGVVFRLANGFGAPVSLDVPCWDLVVNEMCRQAVTTGKISIRSSGESWRNFIPLGDVVEALGRAATGGIQSGLYNLGAAKSMALKEMALLVADTCRRTLAVDPRVTVGAPSVDGPTLGGLDYRIARLAAAGFEPTHGLSDEIESTLLQLAGER